MESRNIGLINPSWKKMDVGVILLRDKHDVGGCITCRWSDDILKKTSGLAFDLKATRFQVEYLDSPLPNMDGYYRLIAIKIMAGGNGAGDSVSDFLTQFAMNEWRRLGTNFQNIVDKPDGGDSVVGFFVCKKDDLLLMASTWVKNS